MTAILADRRQTLLISEMMNRLGIEPGGGVLPQYGLRYAAAERNCAECGAKAACRKWLHAHEVARLAPPFCPNGDTFFELQFDQHIARLA